MKKNRRAKRNHKNVIPRRSLTPVLAIALVLSALVTGAVLANRASGSAGRKHTENTGQEVSIQSLSPASPSKEYHYVGGRLLATTEGCGDSISPTSNFFSQMGGDGTVNLVAPTGCNWTVTNNQSWVVLTSAESGSGNGEITFEVRENFTGNARQGTIIIAGLTYTLVQDAGLTCSYTISPTSAVVNGSGGTGTINVTTGAQCAWQAVSNDSWVTVTSGNVGIGNGVVTYSVAVNSTGTGRNGTITIGGEEFTVKQSP